MKLLQDEYSKLLDSMELSVDKVDMSAIDRHVEYLKSIPFFLGSAVSIYDSLNRRHVYESVYHRELFSDENGEYSQVKIHSDDMPALLKNAIAILRHVYQNCMDLRNYKFLREYRVMIRGVYKRVIEEMQIIGMDTDGKPWLTMSIVNVSPNQDSPFKVNSSLVDLTTGDVFAAPDDFYDKDMILTHRETEILNKIAQGLLSKEIADRLGLSVHTVNTHRQRILAKLNVNNSIEAVKYASVLGLIKT